MNVRVIRVQAILKDARLSPEQRQQHLMALAHDSQSRQKLFTELLDVARQRQEAKQAFESGADPQAFKKDVPLAAQETKLLQQVESTNLMPGTLETILDLPAAERQKQLQARQEQLADFPSMQQAITGYVAAWDKYEKVRDNLDAGAELKRLLRGSGVLSFHILADDISSDRRAEMARVWRSAGRWLLQPMTCAGLRWTIPSSLTAAR